jgi:membrane fusion protein (multidrug efflux system)
VAETTTTPEETAKQTETAPPKKSRRGIIFVVLAVLVVAGLGFWWHSTYFEDTDDAQVSGHLIQVSARIAGQVQKVYVDENQFIHKGDPIVDLDPRDFQVAVENAQASLASAQANAAAANVNVPLTDINTGANLRSAGADVSGASATVQQARGQLDAANAQVLQAAANNTKAQQDLERYKPLVEKDVISKQQYDAAVAAAAAAQATLTSSQASAAAAKDAVGVAQQRQASANALLKYAETGPQQVAVQSAKAKQAIAQVQAAQAQLDQAKLNLSYAKIVAPEDGIVTRKSVEINQNVSVGQNLMTLVSLSDIWITANFKETQLKQMHKGQHVEVAIDATGKKYSAVVTQVGGATGSVLSLFPPENATGNYVKVVQRIPVRLDFTDLKNEDPNHELRPGLSVEPKVRVKD